MAPVGITLIKAVIPLCRGLGPAGLETSPAELAEIRIADFVLRGLNGVLVREIDCAIMHCGDYASGKRQTDDKEYEPAKRRESEFGHECYTS
jgi:hypothetical protein